MSKDPAFLFYPGDYLRDTQCLSEKSQVAYDRIICEHMRNICISKQQLNFFTKRLSDDEKTELEMVLSKVDGGYQIRWVSESIIKRRAYSKSRSDNRLHKKTNICETYDEHMENEIEIVNECVDKDKKRDLSHFETLWSKYPKKDGKREASKHYLASVKTENDKADIEKALNNYMEYLKTNKTSLQYTKNGSTWFNNWKDWVKIETAKGGIETWIEKKA